MRNKIAVPLIVLGVLMMLVGIGQRTFWAPPETVTAQAPAGSGAAPVAVLDAALLASHPDGAEVTIRSEDGVFLAVGRAADVDAWIGDAAATRISSAPDDALSAETTEGEATVPNPSGSDLWVTEETAQGELSYSWAEPAEGEWSVLIASDGTAPAPTDITVSWANDEGTPLAVPLIIAGALVAVLGLALAFIARTGGRTPPAPGSRRAVRDSDTAAQKTVAGRGQSAGAVKFSTPGAATIRQGMAGVLAAALAGGLALAVVPAAASATESGEDSRPVVLDSQLTRILGSVAGTVQKADAARDASLLKDRAASTALSLREANYAAAAKAPDTKAPAAVAASPLLTDMVSSGTGFPRTVVAVTQGQDNTVPQALMLVQASPRENYKLVSAIQMLPGTTFPQPPANGTGVSAVAADSSEGLTMSPQGAVDALADALTYPDGVNKETFAANSFAEAVTTFQASVTANPDNEFAAITFQHTPVPSDTRALRTADGGAIVFGYMSHSYSSVPREAGDSINLEGTIYETLTGEKNTEAGIDVTHGEAVMLYIPPAGSPDQAEVVGAAQELLSATLK
ncbi:hypothetical protein H9638_10850 [Arthrobacter sp. Sa2BUA2]|uniref:DUF8094 domain-containing protein n=1 Tax=Arthrobacter pullicola TaxID=2762224 RepID=A0ABR8YK77_9MICC|nr:hypothetical protein [Arthrobacter pullicola]MBD8044304.1 hypothetical protein [Arthrobacter pullicola]